MEAQHSGILTIVLSFLFSVCHFLSLSFCLFSPDLLGCLALHRRGAPQSGPPPKKLEKPPELGERQFSYIHYFLSLRELVNQRKNNCVCGLNRGTTNLPIWHIWLTYESHFPPKFHQQLPKPLKVEKSYSFWPNPK